MICPYCTAEHKDDPRNVPGAVTLCLVCGGWIVHSSTGVRRPGMAETKAIAENAVLQRLRGAWEAMQRKLGMVAEGKLDL